MVPSPDPLLHGSVNHKFIQIWNRLLYIYWIVQFLITSKIFLFKSTTISIIFIAEESQIEKPDMCG